MCSGKDMCWGEGRIIQVPRGFLGEYELGQGGGTWRGHGVLP